MNKVNIGLILIGIYILYSVNETFESFVSKKCKTARKNQMKIIKKYRKLRKEYRKARKEYKNITIKFDSVSDKYHDSKIKFFDSRREYLRFLKKLNKACPKKRRRRIMRKRTPNIKDIKRRYKRYIRKSRKYLISYEKEKKKVDSNMWWQNPKKAAQEKCRREWSHPKDKSYKYRRCLKLRERTYKRRIDAIKRNLRKSKYYKKLAQLTKKKYSL